MKNINKYLLINYLFKSYRFSFHQNNVQFKSVFYILKP